MFQFVPNEKQVLPTCQHLLCQYCSCSSQSVSSYDTFTFSLRRKYILLSQVKAANKLLKTIPQTGERRKVDGVPVFGAQNLDIAIATTDGIKWCVLQFSFVLIIKVFLYSCCIEFPSTFHLVTQYL